jgi:hypothetical protein
MQVRNHGIVLKTLPVYMDNGTDKSTVFIPGVHFT